MNDVVVIPLYKYYSENIVGHTLVDLADAPKVPPYRWHLVTKRSRRRLHYYAVTNPGGVAYPLHRLLLGLERGDARKVDHINGNGLDNRRCNIRLASHAENMQNMVSNYGATSRFRGVYWHKGKRFGPLRLGTITSDTLRTN